MMKLIFDGENFETPMLQKLADACNNPDNKIITIYINSRGGRIAILKAVEHIINGDPDRFFLVGFHHLSSCAFELYIKAKCRKELLHGTIGMYHLGVTSIDFNDRMKTVYAVDDAAMERQKKYHLPEILKLAIDCEFTKTEYNKLHAGNDVFIQYDRMLEMQAAYDRNNPSPKYKLSGRSSGALAVYEVLQTTCKELVNKN